MSEYKVCPVCGGKGYVLESNVVDEGLLGFFYDLTEGLNKKTCKLCYGTGKMVVKD